MLAGLKLFKRKSYCETTLGVTGVLKNFTKVKGKQMHPSLFLMKLQTCSNFFTGDCFCNSLVLSMVFDPVKKTLGKIYISKNRILNKKISS